MVSGSALGRRIDRAARSQSASVRTTSAGDLCPSGNSTVIGPVASRTTCQLVTTKPNLPRASIKVPLPYETPSRSGTVIRQTAGSGGSGAMAPAAGALAGDWGAVATGATGAAAFHRSGT